MPEQFIRLEDALYTMKIRMHPEQYSHAETELKRKSITLTNLNNRHSDFLDKGGIDHGTS